MQEGGTQFYGISPKITMKMGWLKQNKGLVVFLSSCFWYVIIMVNLDFTYTYTGNYVPVYNIDIGEEKKIRFFKNRS